MRHPAALIGVLMLGLFLRFAALPSQDFQDAEQIRAVRVLLDLIWVAEINEFPSGAFMQQLGNHSRSAALLAGTDRLDIY